MFQNKNAPNPFDKYLNQTTAGSIAPKDRTLVTVADTDPLPDALKKLSNHRIISAPVFDKDNICVGSFSAETVTSFLWGSKSQPPDWSSVKLSSFTVKDALAGGQTSEEIVPFFESNPISLLAALMRTGVHRVALFTEARELVRTCSESDVVVLVRRLLDKHSELKALASRSIEELGVIDKRVVTVPDSATVETALSTLARNKVPALAVVTSSGMLQANFSASDLRGIVESNLGDLRLEVATFLETHSPASLHPVCVRPDCSLLALLDLLLAKRLHRVWVVDGKEVATGVVSVTEVVGLLSSETANARQVAGDLKGLWRQPEAPVISFD